MLNKIKDKILKRESVVGIIGLGYVGLPLALTFAKNGFKVKGIDIDKDRVERLSKGKSHILDTSDREIKEAMKDNGFTVTADFSQIKSLDAIIICVPTPLYKTKEPDVSYIVAAVKNIKKYMKRGQIIVLESTTYPGTTEEVMLPILESDGLKEGKDFYLAFSPERIDPGNKNYGTDNTPKIIGGISKNSTEVARLLYSQAIKTVVPVSSSKVAEMVKLLENTFRIVNIGLVNEVMLMCDKLGINVWEVIDAAKTKPYGFMPFYPGPGVGGHCLSKDEYVYIKDAETNGLKTVRISDFVKESRKAPGARVHCLQGSTFIRPRSMEALSFDVRRSKMCFKEVRMLSERLYDGAMINIKTAGNRMFSVTTKHPMLVSRDGEIGVKFAEELEVGDEIPVAYDFSRDISGGGSLDLDIIAYLKDNGLDKGVRVKGKGFRWSEHKAIIYKYARPEYGEIVYDWVKDDYMPLSAYLKLEARHEWKVERAALSLVTGRGPSRQSVPAVINVDGEFARLIGYYLSEGCITDDRSLRTRFTFNSGEREYIDDVTGILSRLGIKYSIYRSKVWKSACIKVSSDMFGYLLRDILGCGVGSYSMKIPDKFLLLPKEIKIQLISGILRGDGGVDQTDLKSSYTKNGRSFSHNNNTATANYFTSSDVLFNQVVFLLQDLGFSPSFKKRKNLLNILGHEQLDRLKEMFMGEKKRRLGSYVSGSRKIIPNRNFKKYKTFITARITEISSGTADKVYSMEVADTNTFVASYGIMTHNCIPIDPIYLSWKARMHGFEARFIDLSSQVNSEMPEYAVSKVSDALNAHRKSVRCSKILVVGVAYKKDVKDLRESPSLEIIDILTKKGAIVSYYDPHLPYLKIHGLNLKSSPFEKSSFADSDCVIIVTDHTGVDYEFIAKHSKVVVDTRNVLKGVKDKANIVRL